MKTPSAFPAGCDYDQAQARADQAAWVAETLQDLEDAGWELIHLETRRSFDRYELKLTKHVAPLVREWCSMLLFANFASTARQTDSGKVKGQGKGESRFLFTTRTDAIWLIKSDAANPDEAALYQGNEAGGGVVFSGTTALLYLLDWAALHPRTVYQFGFGLKFPGDLRFREIRFDDNALIIQPDFIRA